MPKCAKHGCRVFRKHVDRVCTSVKRCLGHASRAKDLEQPQILKVSQNRGRAKRGPKILVYRSEGLSLRDMLSLGAWRMGLGCPGKILPSSPPSSSPKGSATF